ncbi:MAG: MFS transporter [Proteobacteria bacterium]|nr:MFS transporter [Pseudomonadota bacterium]
MVPTLGESMDMRASVGSPGMAVAARLSVMMLMEFVVFGAWFATLGLVLAQHGLGAIIGQAYLLSAIAAILSPLLLGAIGDRYLAPRTVLALTHLAGAVLMALLPGAVTAGDGQRTLGLIFAYMLLFQPTLGLVISIALTTLGEQSARFPYVRVFAPLGWVVAGVLVGGLGLSASTGVFHVAAVVGVVLGLYALTLPGSRPQVRGARFSLGDVIGIKALALFRERSFAVLMLCALMTSISLGVYNAFASTYVAALGVNNVAGVLALGQASEVLFVVTIPWVLARIGIKWALLAGMGMWGVRFMLFAMATHGATGLAVLGVALHGICNDYFIIIAAMYISRIAPVDLQAQAQSWLTLMISGFGQAIGSGVGGAIYAARVVPNASLGPAAWTPLWQLPIALALCTALVWSLFFRPAADPENT